MSPAIVVITPFVLVYFALLILALRRPLLARLAFREAARRPGQSAVVVLGLMIGTMAIFAMQVLGDSLMESQTRGAFLAWGRVDLVVSDGGRFFDPALASQLAADPGLRSSLAGIQPGVELPSSVTDIDRGNVKPLVALVGFDSATQARFGSYLLTDGKRAAGQDLAPGEVLISASLAAALEAHTGDRLRVATGPHEVVELRLAGVAQAQGPGAYTLRPAVFSPLANLRPLIGDQGINVIRLSAPGDGRPELDRAHELVPRVRAALQPLPGGSALTVGEPKRTDFEAQVKQVDANRGVFTVLSLFVALAGAALVVNLALALAEERRPRHAVLRALGLGRAAMVGLSMLEGGLYSLAAAVVALIPGAVFGLALVALVYERVHSPGVENNRFAPVQYAVTPGSLALSVAIGGLIVLVTLLATSVRSSRMQISSAIRNLPEPPPRRTRSFRRAALLAGLGLAALAALAAGSPPVRLAGGAGLVVLASALVAGRISDRLRATLIGAALTAWTAASMATIPDIAAPEAGLVVVLGLLTAVFGLSLVVASNLRVLESLLGWLRGGARATLRPSLAYLTRRPLRAGLGTGAFALALTMMTMTSVLIPTFDASLLRGLKEYDIRITAPTRPGLSIPDSVRSRIERAVAMPTRPYRGGVTAAGLSENDTYLPLYSLSRAQLATAPFELASRESRFKSDAAVWQALADDPHLVVSPTYTTPGSTVRLAGPDGPVNFRVAGVVSTIGLWGLAGSEAAMAPFATLPIGTTILAKTAPGADVGAVARQIQRDVFSQGAEAITVKEWTASSSNAGAAFIDMIRLVMGIGLLVGVLSLGILAFRAVVERRRAIGVLRALGYRPGQVLTGMVSEALITAFCGALVGIGVGVPFSALMLTAWLPGSHLTIDISSLAVIVGLLFLAVMAAALPPAWRAAHLTVVDALRVEG